MRRKSLRLTVVMVLFMAGLATAAHWTGGAAPTEPYWDLPANWNIGTEPTASDPLTVNTVMAQDGVTPINPMVDRLVTDAQCLHLWLGNNAAGTLNMVGGKLTVSGWFQIGVNGGTGVLNLSGGDLICSGQPLLIGHTGGASGTINMADGSISVAGADKHFLLGNDASGTGLMNMDGGIINVTGQFNVGQFGQGHLRMAGGQINASGPYMHVPNAGASTGKVELFGGTVECAGRLVMRTAERSHMDLAGGTLILGQDTALQGYIDTGLITAYGGLGTVTVEVVDGKTVVTGTADPDIMARASHQSPMEADTVFGNEVTLGWVAGQGADSHNVYMGTDPNALTLLTADPNQGALSIDLHTTAADLELGTPYFWRVDEIIDANATEGIEASVSTGNLWSFQTLPLELAQPVSPLDGATGVEITDLVLAWTPGLGAIDHDVYFGADAENLVLVSEDQTDPNYAVPETLIKGQTYYWRIDEFDGNDLHPGLVVSFQTTAPAGTSTFTDGAADGSLWSSAENWNAGLPGIGTNARIVNDLGPCVVDANTAAYCTKLELGWDNASAHCQLNVTGGTLTIEDGLLLCRFLGGMGTLRLSGGVINTGFIRGWHGDMWIQMTGGELNVAGNIEIPRSYAADVGTQGVFKLWGGVARADQLTLNANANVLCKLDITEGTLILNGDKRSRINGYVDSGLIVAYDGTGSVVSAYDAATDKTTVIACSEISQADFNADCVVNELDRDLLMSEWGYETPTEVLWDFDMSTDPVGPDTMDLTVRENKGDYAMDILPGTMTLMGGDFTLDIQTPDISGDFDMDLHMISKATSTLPIRIWMPIASESAPGTYSLPHVTQYLAADGTQAVTISNGGYWWVGGYEPLILTGFDSDAFVDITINYDRETESCAYTITDGTKTETGNWSYGSSGGGGDGGDWVILTDTGATGYVDHLSVKIHGTKWYSPYDINKDGVVDQGDLDILESEM